MKRTIAVVLATGAAVAATAFTGGTASAAHCTDNGGPGHSDFATHVQSATHKEGVAHRGWSSCIPGNPNASG